MRYQEDFVKPPPPEARSPSGVKMIKSVKSDNLDINSSCSLVFPLQVHSFQRKALQMSGVREGLLSVQDSGSPQNITHAGQGTEAGQDQVIDSPCRGRTGTLEKP